MNPSRKREAATHLEESFEVSERRACVVVCQPRSTQRYERQPPQDEPALAARLHALVRQHPRYGYRRMSVLLRREGFSAGFDRVYRLWRREGLKAPQMKRKRRRLWRSEQGCLRHRVERKNHAWAWDFVFDRTTSGTSLKCLSVVDEFTRECLCLKVSRRMTSRDIIEVLRGLFITRAVPRYS